MIDTAKAREALEAAGWRSMDSAPKDGAPIRGALKVRTHSGTEWEQYVIWTYDDADEIHPDCDSPWSWDDYELWKPLDTPDTPDPLATHLAAALDEIERLREGIERFLGNIQVVPDDWLEGNSMNAINGPLYTVYGIVLNKLRALLGEAP